MEISLCVFKDKTIDLCLKTWLISPFIALSNISFHRFCHLLSLSHHSYNSIFDIWFLSRFLLDISATCSSFHDFYNHQFVLFWFVSFVTICHLMFFFLLEKVLVCLFPLLPLHIFCHSIHLCLTVQTDVGLLGAPSTSRDGAELLNLVLFEETAILYVCLLSLWFGDERRDFKAWIAAGCFLSVTERFIILFFLLGGIRTEAALENPAQNITTCSKQKMSRFLTMARSFLEIK